MDAGIYFPRDKEVEVKNASVEFLERYRKDGDEFLNHIVTGYETWVSCVNVETKKQSKQWMHTHSPNKSK
jgi:hypothetical protein